MGGAGKILSIAGIVVSLLVGAGIGTVIASVGPKVADPACTAIDSLSGQMSKFRADGAALNPNQNDPSAVRASWQHLLADLLWVQARVTTAEAQARNQSVKAAMLATISDLKTVTSGVQAALRGDLSQITQVADAARKLESDGDAVDSTCDV